MPARQRRAADECAATDKLAARELRWRFGGSRRNWWSAGGVHRYRRRDRFGRGRDRGSSAGFRDAAIAVRRGGAGSSLYAGAALLAAWPLQPPRAFTLNVECASRRLARSRSLSGTPQLVHYRLSSSRYQTVSGAPGMLLSTLGARGSCGGQALCPTGSVRRRSQLGTLSACVSDKMRKWTLPSATVRREPAWSRSCRQSSF